jgi:L-alanine-DL-glutamate epimerase-like enolase superfamily enzyme
LLASALDGPVGIAAAAHAAVALPDRVEWSRVAHGLATERLFATTVSSSGGLLDGPRIRVPEGPGLGVEIDRRALDAHRL